MIKLDYDILNKVVGEYYYYSILKDNQGQDFLLLEDYEVVEKLEKYFKVNRLDDIIDYGFTDEFDFCSNCNVLIDLYNSKKYMVIDDCLLLCTSCLSVDDIIEQIKNNYKQVNEILSHKEIIQEGFKLYNNNIYRHGLHKGDNDKPEDIYKDLKKQGYKDILFNITYKDYYTIEFNVYIRN